MTLLWILLLLFSGGGLAWMGERYRPGCARWIGLASLGCALFLLGSYLPQAVAEMTAPHQSSTSPWWDTVQVPWIPRFGIQFALAIDGLAFLMLGLALVCGLFGLLITWRDTHIRAGFYHANYLWTLAGVVGVFTAQDLFLFFCFWEIMLVPMLFLIAIWGHEQRNRAAIQFFIFTQTSSLLLLVAIVGSALAHFHQTGAVSFSPEALATTLHSGFAETPYAYALMLGFFIAFAVKLPALPFHTWLPDAHTQAPTAGSVLLAAILLKTGAYGLLRFTLPLFPAASAHFSPLAMGIGAGGIIYGALMAFSQTDLKRLIAYSSISHMGFVLLGIYGLSSIAIQGAVAQMVAHGLSTAALFGLAGNLQYRFHTRDMQFLKGVWVQMPRFAALLLFFTVAAMGVPGMANFIGELLVLLGSFGRSPVIASLAAAGLIGAALYGLKLILRVLFGTPDGGKSARDSEAESYADLRAVECTALLLPLVLLIWLGLYPQAMLGQSASWTARTAEEVSGFNGTQSPSASISGKSGAGR